MEKNVNLRGVILTNRPKNKYLTANYRMNPPVLYMTDDIEKAIKWNIAHNRICDTKCNLYWDIWDVEKPRPTLYKPKDTYNQIWKVSEMTPKGLIFYSAHKHVKNAGLRHEGADVYFDRQATPFYIFTSIQKVPLKPTIKTSHEIERSVENAEKLRSTYNPGYEFPEWTIRALPDVYNDLAPQCRVYYSDGSKNDAGLLMVQREPVNIAMKRYYDKKRLKNHFGWDTGYYGKFFQKHDGEKLAPNIAIYCPTLVKLENKLKRVHIINAIGYAFDSKRQPDFQYFQRQRDIYGSQASASELYDRYKRVFAKIYRCARDIGADSIVMSLVGGGVFSELWPKLLDDIWWPALKRVWEDNKEIRLLFMGPEDSGLPNNIGLFPQNLRHLDVNLEKTLFVNAWDPWSIAGNGNAMDNSLDGHMGRCSMIAVLTWPLTNFTLTGTPLIKVIQ